MNEKCGCCGGIEQLTPAEIANRPGLNALIYRAGTHGSFLETMLARLSNLSLYPPLQGLTTRALNDPAIAFLDAWATVADVLTFYQERIANEGYLRTATERRSILELAKLVGYTLRPGVAASVFLAYTLEKDHNVTIPIGNRAQSVPGPGELPQSFETAEVLEARADWNALKVRLTRPQLVVHTKGKADDLLTTTADHHSDGAIYLQGVSTKLSRGDTQLFIFSESDDKGQVFKYIKSVEVQKAANRTKILLQVPPEPFTTPETFHTRGFLATSSHDNGVSLFSRLVKPLSLPPSQQPHNTQRLERNVPQAFATASDIHPQMLVNFTSLLASNLYNALANVKDPSSTPSAFDTMFDKLESIQTLRVKAALFGHNLPSDEEDVLILQTPPPSPMVVRPGETADPKSFQIALDAEYKKIVTGSWAVVEYGDSPNNVTRLICKVTDVQAVTKSGKRVVVSTGPGGAQFATVKKGSPIAVTTSDETLAVGYDDQHQFTPLTPEHPEKGKPVIVTTVDDSPPPGVTQTSSPGIKMRVTQVSLQLVSPQDLHDQTLPLATTTVYIQSEELQLAEEPVDAPVGLGTEEEDHIELDNLYDGLKSGQRLIISGERTDVLQPDKSSSGGASSIPGIRTSELVMLAAVRQDVQTLQTIVSGASLVKLSVPLPGDKKHSFLQFAKPLAYTYKRETVTISANVVRATHGETRSETLGSGDGSKALQRFALTQAPLTYLAATTPAGAQSTLQVRVNNLLWHEAESLAILRPKDHSYILETDNSDKTSVIFGNGVHGTRLPTGVENIRAVYRTGIGKPGNVKAGQISLLATRPLGVKSVMNPLPASGGADRDSLDQARRNIPLAVMALDRLVSVQDYADFARTYAGVGKASAVQLRARGDSQVVHVTIAGAENIPIDPTSDLYNNLVQALFQFGDPHLPLRVDLAEILFLVISVKIRLLPDYALEFVAPTIRAAMLDAFSFDRRELGQPVFQSEVLSVIQGIAGVDYADLVIMGAVRQELVLKAFDDVEGGTDSSSEGGEIDEEGETSDEEKEEVFLEELRLDTHRDVIVRLAQINPDLPKKPQPSNFFLPAQLAFLTPDIPDTLIITELPQ